MLDLVEAEAWVDAALAPVGARRTGELETFRTRPWGVVLRAETSDGVVWMKEPRGATAFEVPLYWLLAECAPEAILVPLAVDEERGWVLLPDGGTSLGERAEGEELVEAMASALGRYARVQRALEPRVDDLRRIGIADMTPGAMPARFDEAIRAGARYSRSSGDPADAESLERIAGHRATFLEWCEELADRPGGASLDHNDLHPWNVLGSPDQPEGLRFYDWGDSVIAHPFATTLVPLGVIARLRPTSRRAAPGRLPRAVRGPRVTRGSDRHPGAGLPCRKGGEGAHVGTGSPRRRRVFDGAGLQAGAARVARVSPGRFVPRQHLNRPGALLRTALSREAFIM